MTDTPEPRAERLSRELAAAFWNRADLYRLILEALIAELGPRRAETVLAGAIEARGREVARQAFAGFGPNQARAVGEAFLAASPDGGRHLSGRRRAQLTPASASGCGAAR